jgi:hypothetical protein
MSRPEGFSFQAGKDELVDIFHHGRMVTTLRGKPAVRFLLQTEHLTEDELQHRMARITGNYKRGNERRRT